MFPKFVLIDFSLTVEAATLIFISGRGWLFHLLRRHCLVSSGKNINPSLVLVQPRKTRPYITERLLMGRKESNQTKNHELFGPRKCA